MYNLQLKVDQLTNPIEADKSWTLKMLKDEIGKRKLTTDDNYRLQIVSGSMTKEKEAFLEDDSKFLGDYGVGEGTTLQLRRMPAAGTDDTKINKGQTSPELSSSQQEYDYGRTKELEQTNFSLGLRTGSGSDKSRGGSKHLWAAPTNHPKYRLVPQPNRSLSQDAPPANQSRLYTLEGRQGQERMGRFSDNEFKPGRRWNSRRATHPGSNLALGRSQSQFGIPVRAPMPANPTFDRSMPEGAWSPALFRAGSDPGPFFGGDGGPRKFGHNMGFPINEDFIRWKLEDLYDENAVDYAVGYWRRCIKNGQQLTIRDIKHEVDRFASTGLGGGYGFRRTNSGRYTKQQWASEKPPPSEAEVTEYLKGYLRGKGWVSIEQLRRALHSKFHTTDLNRLPGKPHTRHYYDSRKDTFTTRNKSNRSGSRPSLQIRLAGHPFQCKECMAICNSQSQLDSHVGTQGCKNRKKQISQVRCEPSKSVFIGNVPMECTKDEIKAILEKHNLVVSNGPHVRTGSVCKYAVVEFTSVDMRHNALGLTGQIELREKALDVKKYIFDKYKDKANTMLPTHAPALMDQPSGAGLFGPKLLLLNDDPTPNYPVELPNRGLDLSAIESSATADDDEIMKHFTTVDSVKLLVKGGDDSLQRVLSDVDEQSEKGDPANHTLRVLPKEVMQYMTASGTTNSDKLTFVKKLYSHDNASKSPSPSMSLSGLEALAELAVDEDWGRNFVFLRAYIEHLLVRLLEEGKVMYYGTKSKIGALWFHSGLQSQTNDAVVYVCATNVQGTPFFALDRACTAQEVRELCKLDDDVRVPLEKASFTDRESPNHVCFNLERFHRSPFKSLAVPTALLGSNASSTKFSQKMHLITTELRATGDRAAEDPSLAISVFNREPEEDRGTIFIVLVFKVDSKQFVAVLQPTNNKDPNKYRYIIKDLLWVDDPSVATRLGGLYNGARLMKKQERKVNGKVTLSFLARLRPDNLASIS